MQVVNDTIDYRIKEGLAYPSLRGKSSCMVRRVSQALQQKLHFPVAFHTCVILKAASSKNYSN